MRQVDIYHWIVSLHRNSALLNYTLLLECNGFGLAGNTEKQSSAGLLLGEGQRVILEHKNYVKQFLCQGVLRNERSRSAFDWKEPQRLSVSNPSTSGEDCTH